jgi:putative salt-induced outer membrane protein YdiY/ketosteroid isomerase-like protein
VARGVCRLAAAALALVLWPAALPAQDLAAEIRAADTALRHAIAARDAGAIRALLTDDFRASPGVDVDGGRWLDSILGLCGAGSTTVGDVQVVLQSDSALASYVATTTLDSPCMPAVRRTRVATLWRLTDTGWRLALRTDQLLDAVPPQRSTYWAGGVELNTLSARGNVNTFTFGSSGELAWQRGRSRTTSRLAFLRTTSEGQARGHSIDAFVRQARTLTAVAELFGRAVYQRDMFAGIEHRYVMDAGLGLVVAEDGHRLQMTLGAGSTWERRLNSEDEKTAVATAGAQYRVTLSPNTVITEEALATGSLSLGTRWRLDNTLSVTSVLREPFSLRASYGTKYVHQPVPGFRRLDAVLSVGLLARF